MFADDKEILATTNDQQIAVENIKTSINRIYIIGQRDGKSRSIVKIGAHKLYTTQNRKSLNVNGSHDNPTKRFS